MLTRPGADNKPYESPTRIAGLPLLAYGAEPRGIIAIGGLAVGLLAFGGGAVGWWAFGGGALGYYALGGLAVGDYAYAGKGVAVGYSEASGRQRERLLGEFLIGA